MESSRQQDPIDTSGVVYNSEELKNQYAAYKMISPLILRVNNIDQAICGMTVENNMQNSLQENEHLGVESFIQAVITTPTLLQSIRNLNSDSTQKILELMEQRKSTLDQLKTLGVKTEEATVTTFRNASKLIVDKEKIDHLIILGLRELQPTINESSRGDRVFGSKCLS